METKKNPKTKKKKSAIAKFFLGVLWFFVGFLCLILGWFIFSAFEKKDTLSIMPNNFSVYLHTDSVWDSINPVIDLKAADILLSSNEENNMASAREVLMNLRASSLREKWYVDFALSRELDAALYSTEEKNSFLAILDLSFLSAITRLAKFVGPFIKVENLIYYKTSPDGSVNNYFEYALDEESLYIKPYHNLVIATNNYEFLSNMEKIDYKTTYAKEELILINEKSQNNIKILVDARSIVDIMDFEDNSFGSVKELLRDETYASVSFDITDEDILINAKLPLDASQNAAIKDIIENTSTVPSIIPKLGNYVQYYTVLNAGSLQELKNAAMPMLPPEKDAEKIWATAEGFCKLLFKMSVEELIFSWTGREFAVFGLEGLNTPIFAIQVADENKREQVFEDVFSTLLLDSDSSLIVDGVRLPRIRLPIFLQSLLELFNVNLSAPYYLIKDDFIYFSASPECLSAVNSSLKSGLRLVTTDTWKNVSVESNHQSSLELFYDLERSIPFFLRGDNVISEILQLYSIGLCEIQFSQENLNFALHSVSRPSGNLRMISGYPISLPNKVTPEFYREGGKDSKNVFWVEAEETLASMNLNSMETKRKNFQEKISIAVPTTEKVLKKGALWVCTQEGTVYLLDNNLEVVKNFPVFTGLKTSADCSVFNDMLVFPVEDGSLCSVNASGEFSLIPLNTGSSIKSKASVLNDYLAVYEKAFLGNIHIMKGSNNLVKEYSLPINGIAYGSPALIQKEASLYTGFITQAGSLYIWKDGQMITENPIRLFGVFYTNLVAGNNYFYALSANAVLYKISITGEVIKVQIPDMTAKNGYLTVSCPEEKGIERVYVSVDGNIIYGFNQNLELLTGFPLAGWGRPLFVDVNADKNEDCLVFSLDNKLSAWNLR